MTKTQFISLVNELEKNLYKHMGLCLLLYKLPIKLNTIKMIQKQFKYVIKDPKNEHGYYWKFNKKGKNERHTGLLLFKEYCLSNKKYLEFK